MKCVNCGNEINENAKFCTYCGNAVVPPAPEPVQPPVAPVPPTAPVEQAAPPVQPSYYPPQQPVNAPSQPPVASENSVPVVKKWWFWVLIVAIVALIAGIAVIAIGNSGDDKDKDNDTVITTEADEDSDEDEEDDYEDKEDEEDEDETEDETEEHDDSYDDFDDGYNYDDSEDFEYINIKTGEKTVIDDLIEITVEEGAWADYIYASNEDPSNPSLPSVDGESYIMITATVKNVSSKELEIGNMFCELKINDKYEITDSVEIYHEYEGGIFLSEVYESITPLETETLFIICSISDEMYSETETIDFYFGFDDEFSSDVVYYGFDECDYIYRASFKNDEN